MSVGLRGAGGIGPPKMRDISETHPRHASGSISTIWAFPGVFQAWHRYDASVSWVHLGDAQHLSGKAGG